MKAVTGEDVTTEDLYKMGAKITTLQRANTARGMVGANGQMGTNDFRNVHDVVTEWPFTMDPDIEVFTEGTNKMDKEDFQTALTMMYECFGWDPELGCPTGRVPGLLRHARREGRPRRPRPASRRLGRCAERNRSALKADP